METRSRKRAAAAAASAASSSSSASASKRTRRPSSSAAAVASAPSMDPSPSSRRRARGSASDKGKDPDPSSDPSPPSAPDDDDAVAPFPHSFTSASTALQGLLRRLGAGLDELLPTSAAASSSSTSSQLKRILSGLQADVDESRQLQSLMQLCEMLSIGTEESLAAFPVDAFVPILVGLLGPGDDGAGGASPDVMLLAARALSNLVDVLPSSCSAVVHYGAIPCFCARLLTIEYMDLAEQSLQALKKISQEHPTACLRAGALMAVLSYLDFFSTGVQRVALSTAANICRKLPSDASNFVMEAVPLLTNLLNHHDSKVLEHASVCLTRIAESFASYPEKLDDLCNHGLVAQAASLVSISNSAGQASLSTSTYTGLIRLLSTCASGSLLAAKTLLLLGISGTLKDILSGSGLVAGTSVSPTLSRPIGQMFEIVSLADDLLPHLPLGIISLPTYFHVLVKGSSTKKSASTKQDGVSSTENERSGHERLLREHPELLQQFGMDLLPIMTQVYGSSVNAPIRHKCLSIIGKLMYYSSAEMIQSLLGTTNISSFLAGILAWKDPQVLIPALQIAEIMMEKLPETFSKLFVREGVVHAVESLICPEFSDLVPSQPVQHNWYWRLSFDHRSECSGSALQVAPVSSSRVQRSEAASKPTVPSGNNSESGIPGTTAGASSMAAPVPSSRHPTTRSKSSAASSGTSKKDSQEESTNTAKGKGKAVAKLNADESKGPHTRNATCRKAASEKDLEMKRAHGDSSSEGEELDTSPIEIDDALMIDDDDMSEDEEDDHEVLQDGSLPLCVQDGVHDVKLGDTDDCTIGSASDSQVLPPSGSSTRNIISRGADANTFGSRGAMSFVAATMAGLASVGGRGVRGSRDRHGLSLGGSMNEQNKLIFMACGKHLSKHLTVYQALQHQLMFDEDDEEKFNGSDLSNDGNHFWGDMFTITYQKADSQAEKGAQGVSTSLYSKSDPCRSISESQGVSLLDSILQGELPCDLERTNSTYNILALLRVLEGLNQLAPRLRVHAACDDFAEGKIITLDELYETGAKVPSEEFVNSKLTPKLARQMQDVLALCSGSLPSWCYQMTKACSFLFPFETRRQYFYSTAFGLSRALNRLQQQQGDNQNAGGEREVRFGRLQRQKVRVSRNRILDSAAKVMEMFSSQRAVLEVEYFGEVGTGLGPTLEFYTLLSHELQSACLGLWRSSSSYDSGMQIDRSAVIHVSPEDNLAAKEPNSDLPDNGSNLIQAPFGLFPRPWPPNTDASEGSKFFKAIEYFRLVGRVMAKVLQDGRLLDLPLSTAFYKLILGQELDLFDIISFDAEFGKTLQELQVLVERKKFLELTYGTSYPDYVLKAGEESTIVNIYNLEAYVTLVVDATVKSGIMRQVEAFKSGFNQVFDISSLKIFSPQELDYLICGRREIWEPESLVDNIKFDHGFTAKSPAIVNLLEIMAEFTPDQQHAFCQFVTGAPRLPPGGLAALSPKLTIVRKHPSNTVNASNATGLAESADDDLPSVMTCANYLKLPPYSTKEVMRKKLLYAVIEGRGSFDLS
ncbi:hypothetical protein GUJ93_ZPchr0002g24179 [Zizania palustris]|uniref:HECT domain-containing protein n=1 Tax=Zizania palustris TaxID=103762 RepID=A0A8J5VRM9_ZIZPA|nr:hypothetical protein GUJ93_ZPchr0002g24179 [Zizania palustris]